MGLAPIECLPVELLQPIFIAADHNIALIQASHHIAARLSSEYIYNSTCDYYLTEVRGKRAEQTAAQTFIFASRWMTWDFFKSWIVRRFEPAGCLCGLTTDEGCFDAQWPPDFQDATQMVFSRSHFPRLAFVKGRLPKKLFTGSLTQDKVEFLRFLLWITAMTVDWTNPEVAHATITARKNAMLERNLEAVELFNHNRRLGRPADLDTVRFAVIEAGCDRSIVYDTILVSTMWHGIKPARHCAELYKWCDRQKVEGNPKGQWLWTKLVQSCIERSQEDAEKVHCPGSYLDASDSYDGGPEDTLTVSDLRWNKVCRIHNLFATSFSFPRSVRELHDAVEVSTSRVSTRPNSQS
ncbi:hypothetical protein J4E90_010186 [Alternaria incomplexa]|uniref:uncharacterized protein n=1 Tax=Alternaria incomplexa TaxID=1187928 RepID=UPI0022211C6B|nr:uncharacterized protein J4E90_010186 [Alternaria incomplexa]KAI4906727.1 hypothetical protein J4E90_010186 [Alternaria incomplexa]